MPRLNPSSHRLVWPALLMVSILSSPAATTCWAQQEGPAAEQESWQMEELHRKEKKSLRGLILRTRKDEIEFIEIVRPPGKPMYLVVHHYHPRQVEKLVRLENSQRQQLYARIVELLALKSRIQIEKVRMEDIDLEEVVRDDRLCWMFENPWFTLESTAGDQSTRRCVVRILGTFAAFRHLLPPRVEPKTKMRIVIFGSMDEYRSRFEAAHPAFYQRSTNSIYAASEMTRFADRLAQLREQTNVRREQYQRLNQDMPSRLASLTQQLQRTDHSEKSIQLELRARTAAWQREYESKLAQLNQVDRRNAELFWEVSYEMFQRLKHEAFHAYLENYVFPHDRHDVPHWLNEGLAQLFEHAQMDADQFRLDAPHPKLLPRLRAELASDWHVSLSELIRADAKSFWAAHDQRQSSDRYYLYAWGLAHFLVFDQGLLEGDTLADFVTKGSDNLLPESRITALTHQSIEKTERQWHRYIQQLDLRSN